MLRLKNKCNSNTTFDLYIFYNKIKNNNYYIPCLKLFPLKYDFKFISFVLWRILLFSEVYRKMKLKGIYWIKLILL